MFTFGAAPPSLDLDEQMFLSISLGPMISPVTTVTGQCLMATRKQKANACLEWVPSVLLGHCMRPPTITLGLSSSDYSLWICPQDPTKVGVLLIIQACNNPIKLIVKSRDIKRPVSGLKV